jgi:hypothetical protein
MYEYVCLQVLQAADDGGSRLGQPEEREEALHRLLLSSDLYLP